MDGTTKPLSVLLIEDSPEEAELIQVMLTQSRRERVRVEHVSRLCDGLACLASAPVDVILLDFSLPDSKGLVSFEKVRAAAPHVPIVILTNLDDEETALLAVREGAQDYLVKRQVDNELLLRSIRYAIERMHAERALWESEERYALAVSGANDGIWDWNLTTGIAYFSPRWKAMLGYRDDEIGFGIEEWFSRVHPEDNTGLRKALEAHLTGAAACRRRAAPAAFRARTQNVQQERHAHLGAFAGACGSRRRRQRHTNSWLADRHNGSQASRRAAPPRRPVRRAHAAPEPHALPGSP